MVGGVARVDGIGSTFDLIAGRLMLRMRFGTMSRVRILYKATIVKSIVKVHNLLFVVVVECDCCIFKIVSDDCFAW